MSFSEKNIVRLPVDAVLNVRKPVGWSSFDLIRWFKRRIPDVKIGHAGTLDPFADGIVIVCFGKATKKISTLVNLPKEYVVTIRLGAETDTLDITGQVTGWQKVPELDDRLLELAGSEFIGTIEQVPPSFSALKVNGQRAYKLARAGKHVPLEPRTITIYELKIIEHSFRQIVLKIVCSKGTYIRSLARDYAHKLGTVGYASRLTRTRIGDFTMATAIELKDFTKQMLDQNI
ncbi:tRNA pseudouridine(55) synthase TruB [candidate division KSB1 bacterium]|nr:tRNA pseudouridine(55) synthase TruB [candidate division KSB1 bacterium]